MFVKESKYHKRLSSKQLELLVVLYRFRFGSTDLVSELAGKDRSTIYESLFVLEKQKLVHKFYDKTYRLRQRPAVYCLAAKGIRYLMNNTRLDQTVLRSYYKNKSTDEELVDKYLYVFRLYLKLERLYGARFSIYTRPEMVKEAFIWPLPQLLLTRKAPAKAKHTIAGQDNKLSEPKLDYVLDIYPAGYYSWAMRRRLQAWQELDDDSDYEPVNVLLLAQNESTEKRLIAMTEFTLQDFNFYVSREDLLLGSSDGKVWIDVVEYDEDDVERINIT